MLTSKLIAGSNEYEKLLIVTNQYNNAIIRNSVEDLTSFLKQYGFKKVELLTSLKSTNSSTLALFVSDKNAIPPSLSQLSGPGIDLKILEDQEALIIPIFNPNDTQNIFLITGGDGLGVQYAMYEFMDQLKVTDNKIIISEKMFYHEKPAYKLRGIYAHLHWQYNNPYALRSWEIEDWITYINLLARMRFNLLQIWSFVGSLPTPLSEADSMFLHKFKLITDYAKHQRGFEVWIGECANNVAETDGGLPIEKREYFQVEVKKDPADSIQFTQIMNNRENLYKEVNNADGYWIIDSDPGGYAGSTDDDFVKILLGNRKLMDKYCDESEKKKMIYWIWDGWNISTRKTFLDNPESWEKVLTELKERLKEPWIIEMASANQIPIVEKMGMMNKSIYFPYNAIEWEPSTPHTTLRFAKIDSALAIVNLYKEINGVLGNAQTPYVQLPTIAYFAEKLWYGSKKLLDEFEVLKKLAKIIHPSNVNIISKAWMNINSENKGILKNIVNQLTTAEIQNEKFGFISDDLILQLNIRTNGLDAIDEIKNEQYGSLSVSLTRFAENVLKWQEKTGYIGSIRPGIGRKIKYPVCGPMLWNLRKELKNISVEFIREWRKKITDKLEKVFDKEVVKFVLDEIDGSRIPIRFHMR